MPKTHVSPSRDKYYFKEIGWILLIKLGLLIALRLLFFASPEIKPDATAATSTHLLSASATAPSLPSPVPLPVKRSSHDQ